MPVPQTFRAAIVPSPGAQHIVGERSLAPLEPGEVAIKVTAAAINPGDWKIRDYKVLNTEFPAVQGMDGAGEIVPVGSAVSGFTPGDRVFFQGIVGGVAGGSYDYATFQQYCKMPAVLVGKTPGNITDEAASGITLAAVAAAIALYDKECSALPAPWDRGGEQAGAGKAIVIIGGSSSVGQYAIQMAKLSGFERIITNASAVHADYLRTLGAHVVLDRATHSTAEDFRTAIGDLSLAVVFETIATRPTVLLALDILEATGARDGQFVSLLLGDEETVALGQSRNPPIPIRTFFGDASAAALRYLTEPLLRHLGGENGYLAMSRIVPNRTFVVAGGLTAVDAAFEKVKRGVSGVKVVVRPQEGLS